MSIDEVMAVASEYRASLGFAESLAQKSNLQHAIEQHVAEEVARMRATIAKAKGEA